SVSPAAIFALGLGEVHLHSALGEPLQAEIELIGATPEELRSLQAGLASRDTYSRFEIEYSQHLNRLNFTVATGRAGASILRVSSSKAITVPFFTLLFDLNWPRGRLLREYTLLLAPPVYMPGEQAAQTPVAAPQTRAPVTSDAQPGQQATHQSVQTAAP